MWLIDNIHCDNLIDISLYLQLIVLSLWCCDTLVHCHLIYLIDQLSLLWCGSISDWVSHLGRHHLFDPWVLLWLDASGGSPSGVSATWGMLGPRVWTLLSLVYLVFIVYLIFVLNLYNFVSNSNCGVLGSLIKFNCKLLVTNHLYT